MRQRRHQNFENGQWVDCTKDEAQKFGPNGAYGGWEIRVLPTADEIAVIQHLLDLARQVDHALDDAEEVEDSGGVRSHNIAGQDFDDVVGALDAIEDLPDDKPGMTLGPAGKAEWALRRLLPNTRAGISHPSMDDSCQHGNAHLVHDCLRCGAPVCCGKCCADDSVNEIDVSGEIAYQLTKKLVIDMPTARAAVDAAIAALPAAQAKSERPNRSSTTGAVVYPPKNTV